MTTFLKEALIEKQRQLGEVDAEFAARLGLDRSNWAHIRNGRHLPVKFAPVAIRAFPDLLGFHLKDIHAAEPEQKKVQPQETAA